MASQMIPAADGRTLETLARDINRAHHACETALKDGLRHALEAGRLLIESKGILHHGGWLVWLQSYCACSPRLAQRYMRIAQQWPKLSANTPRVSHLSLRQALRDLERTAGKLAARHFTVVRPTYAEAMRALEARPEFFQHRRKLLTLRQAIERCPPQERRTPCEEWSLALSSYVRDLHCRFSQDYREPDLHDCQELAHLLAAEGLDEREAEALSVQVLFR